MHAQLYSIQNISAGKVSVTARPRGGDWLTDEIKALREADVDVLVSLLTPAEVQEFSLAEEDICCQEQDISYFSFPIADLTVPPFSDPTFTFIEQLYTQLATGKHIALHCRQGLGRSVLIAATLLILSGLTPEQAFEQLSQVRGYQVPETAEQRAWVRSFYQRQSQRL